MSELEYSAAEQERGVRVGIFHSREGKGCQSCNILQQSRKGVSELEYSAAEQERGSELEYSAAEKERGVRVVIFCSRAGKRCQSWNISQQNWKNLCLSMPQQSMIKIILN